MGECACRSGRGKAHWERAWAKPSGEAESTALRMLTAAPGWRLTSALDTAEFKNFAHRQVVGQAMPDMRCAYCPALLLRGGWSGLRWGGWWSGWCGGSFLAAWNPVDPVAALLVDELQRLQVQRLGLGEGQHLRNQGLAAWGIAQEVAAHHLVVQGLQGVGDEGVVLHPLFEIADEPMHVASMGKFL